MKKMALRILTLGLASAMVISMAACSGNNASSTGSSAASSSAASSSASSAAAGSSAAAENESSAASAGTLTGKFATIEEFVNSDIMQTQLESMKSSLGESGMQIELTGEGNKLIYSYTMSVDTDTEGAAEQLESALEEQASLFEGIASSVKLAVDVESPIVVIRYLDSEGNEIYSREFTEAE